MQIIIVDRNTEALEQMKSAAAAVYPSAELVSFTDPMLAIKHAYSHPPDMAVAAYDIKRVNGIEFLELIRRIAPTAILIFVDGDDKRLERAREYISHCLSAPLTADELQTVKNTYLS